jgi:hypothetical protein
VHDVTDYSAARSWLNSPWTASLEADIYKATNIARCFSEIGRLQPERAVPAAVLRGAAGFAILSTLKVPAGSRAGSDSVCLWGGGGVARALRLCPSVEGRGPQQAAKCWES